MAVWAPVVQQWHNVFHIVELILSLVCVGLLAPVMQDDDNTAIIFYTLIAWTLVDVAVLVVYFDVAQRLLSMDEVDTGRHFILRAVIAVIIGLVYFCEAVFLILISTAGEGPVLPLQLSAGVLALVTGVVHVLECLASRQSVHNISWVDAAFAPACDGCCWTKEKQPPA